MIVQLNINCTAVFFVKLSFFFYFRLFKSHKIICWFVYNDIFANGLFYFAIIVIYVVVVSFSPDQSDININWLMRVKKYKFMLNHLNIIQIVFDIFSDIYFLVISIRSIFQFQFSMQQKLNISSIFLIEILWVSNSFCDIFLIKLNFVNSALFYALLSFLFIVSSLLMIQIMRDFFLFIALT